MESGRRQTDRSAYAGQAGPGTGLGWSLDEFSLPDLQQAKKVLRDS